MNNPIAFCKKEFLYLTPLLWLYIARIFFGHDVDAARTAGWKKISNTGTRGGV